ncbi:SigE family RNA polymerase sigma factor [Janibacter alkaliphilus]
MVGERPGGFPAAMWRPRSRAQQPAGAATEPLVQEQAAAEALTFEEFVGERGESLMRYAYLVTGQTADAEDLFQETFADVHRKWDRVSASDHPYAYVRTMMTNRYTSSRRRRWHGERPTDPQEMPVESRVTQDHSSRVASDDALWQLLGTLSERMRTILVLRYFEDLDDAEIADTLGIAVSTVRATASRAIGQLRERGDLP